MANKDHPGIGADFQEKVREYFSDEVGFRFEKEVAIPIGVDVIKKPHKFDIVCDEKKIAIECKCYTWTVSGNVPSAKMGFTNEAALYLSLLPEQYEKYIVMLYSYNAKRKKTLAEYYYETNRHLLGNIHLAEFDPANKLLRVLSDIPENYGDIGL